MNNHYLFLSSNDSKDEYPDNMSTEFTIELPRVYTLEGQWECALAEIEPNVNTDTLYVCADLCQESYAENTMIPVLRRLRNIKKGKKPFEFPVLYYVPVKKTHIDRIRIFIRGGKLQLIAKDKTITRCVLHLRRRWIE